MSTLGHVYNEHTGSCLQWAHWVPLTMSTLGPAYNEHTGSRLQWAHWVLLTMSTLGHTYNQHHWVTQTHEHTGVTLTGEQHWVPLYKEHTGSRLQWVHSVMLRARLYQASVSSTAMTQTILLLIDTNQKSFENPLQKNCWSDSIAGCSYCKQNSLPASSQRWCWCLV